MRCNLVYRDKDLQKRDGTMTLTVRFGKQSLSIPTSSVTVIMLTYSNQSPLPNISHQRAVTSINLYASNNEVE